MGTPSNITVIYTYQKSTLSGYYSYVADNSFSHCCIPSLRNQAKFLDNSNL